MIKEGNRWKKREERVLKRNRKRMKRKDDWEKINWDNNCHEVKMI
jgi:hypothetical protein